MPGELKERLQDFVTRRRLKQTDAAELLGIAQGMLCKYLQGTEPRGRRYYELMAKLDRLDEEDGGAGALVAAGPVPVAPPDAAAAEPEPPRERLGMFAWLRGAR